MVLILIHFFFSISSYNNFDSTLAVMSSVYKDKKLGLYNKHGMVDRPDSEMIGEILKGRQDG